MKKHLLALLTVSALFTSSCNKNDDNSQASISTSLVTNTVLNGTWHVTYYWDNDHEETASFSGYNFTFGAGNTLTATKNGTTIAGTWSAGNDDSQVKLILNFASPADFAEISDDWHVTERTDTRIKLEDVSGGNGHTDFLTFEKN